MKVKYKILSNFSVIFLIILVMAMVSYTGLNSIQTSFEEVTEKTTPMMLVVGDITADILLANRTLIAMNNIKDDVALFEEMRSKKNEVNAQVADTLAKFNKIFSNLHDKQLKQNVVTVQNNINELNQTSMLLEQTKEELVNNAKNVEDKYQDFIASTEYLESVIDYLLDNYQGQIKIIKNFYDIRNNFRNIIEILEELYISHSDKVLIEANEIASKSIANANNVVKQIEQNSLIDDFDFNDFNDAFEILRDEITEQHGFFAKLTASVNATAKIPQQMLEINQLTDDTVNTLKGLRAKVSMLSGLANSSAQSSIKKSVVSLTVLAIAEFIILIVIGVLFSRSIQIPLAKINSLITRIADGNLTNKVNYTKADEFGELASSSNKLIDKLSGMIKNIASHSKHIYNSSQIGSELSDKTTERVKEQQMQIVAIDSAMQENKRATVHISNNIVNMLDRVKQSDGHIKEGNSIVDKTKQVLEQLLGCIDNTSGALKTVANSVSEITSVISVVENIAEQTNLLALNAAIEAARAGEQGRGFAVVADEVRSLAGKTQESTKAIDSMVSQLQEATTSSLQAMDDSVQGANSTKEQAEKIITIFANIAQAINEVSEMSVSISSAAEQQASATEEVTDNVDNISKNAEETSNMVVELNKKNQDLISIATYLDQAVNSFTIKE